MHAEFILEIAMMYQESGVDILSEKMEWFRKAGSISDIKLFLPVII